MTFTTILLPLTGFITIRDFINTALLNIEQQDLFSFLSKSMGTLSHYFLSYMLGLAFVANGFSLLDIPHNMNKCCRYIFRKDRHEPF